MTNIEKVDWYTRKTPGFSPIIGKGTGPRCFEYTWRGVILYVLGVGRIKDDLAYVWEGYPDGFKTLPSFVLTAYLNAITMQPQRRVPYAPNEIPGDLITEALNGYIPSRLHMGADFIMHRPIDSLCRKILTEDNVEEVFDWGEKGVVSQCKMEMYDIAGNPVCILRSQHYIAAFGNNGRPKYVSNKMNYPGREPDFGCDDRIADNSAALYRLTGDTYITHIDPEIGKGYGYKGAFMLGLCSAGFAVRLIIQAVILYQPEHVTHAATQLRSATFPDIYVKFQVWKIEEGKLICRMLNKETGKAVIDNCLLEYKQSQNVRKEVKNVRYKKLLSPGKIGSLELKNRAIMTPMPAALDSPDGTVSDLLTAYLTARANGGVGTIITEYCFVTGDGRPSDHQISITDDDKIPGLKKLVDTVHAYGAKIRLQFQHGGGRSMVRVMAPSAIMKQAGKVTPYETTIQDAYDLIHTFIAAAVRAKKAGFDMVEAHCSHGYLLNGSVSPSTNRRTDEFDGRTIGRAKVPAMIIGEIKKVCDEDRPVSVCLNGDDMVSGGNLGGDSTVLAMLMEEAGADLLDVPGGMNGVGYGIAPVAVRTGHNTDPAEEIRRVVSIPVAVAGRINEPECAESLLRKGDVEFITLGRALFADPEFVNKTTQGKEEKTCPCVGCLQCYYGSYGHGGQFRSCMANPLSMRETAFKVRPVETEKKMVAVGTGITGMEVVWTAVARGHAVELFEQGAYPGGQFRIIAIPSRRQMLARACVYYGNMCKKYGVHMHYNTKADRELIESCNPDVVVVATGGNPLVLGIPGLRESGYIVNRGILFGRITPGNKFLILDGSPQGAEAADFMAEHGYEVTVVEMRSGTAVDDHPATQKLLLERLASSHVGLITLATVKTVHPDGVDYEKGGETVGLRGFDSIILVFSIRPEHTLAEELEGANAEAVTVGDAVKAGNAVEAIYRGAVLGTTI